MNTQTKNSLLLLLCSFIWGTAFVAQSAGSGMGAYSFLAGRSWLAVLVLIPTVLVFDAIRRKNGTDAKPKTAAEKKKLLAAGFVCGTLLFAASAAQQIGITINPSTAKAGFLTAMYVVLVPVFGLFLGRKGSAQLWISMVVAVLGLYLLCMKNGFGSIESSDWLLLSCAVLFSFQIIAVDYFSPQVDGVRLSLAEFLVVSVESTAAALLFETPSAAQFAENALPILYCGIMSSGVAYTLQILGQRDLNPAIASLIMCLESVFSALGGWMLLHQNLSAREVFGCVLIFAAVVLAQLPLEMLHRVKKGVPDLMADKTAGAAAAHGRRHPVRADPQKGEEPEHPCAGGRHRGGERAAAHERGSCGPLCGRARPMGAGGPGTCPAACRSGRTAPAGQGDRAGVLYGHER